MFVRILLYQAIVLPFPGWKDDAKWERVFLQISCIAKPTSRDWKDETDPLWYPSTFWTTIRGSLVHFWLVYSLDSMISVKMGIIINHYKLITGSLYVVLLVPLIWKTLKKSTVAVKTQFISFLELILVRLYQPVNRQHSFVIVSPYHSLIFSSIPIAFLNPQSCFLHIICQWACGNETLSLSFQGTCLGEVVIILLLNELSNDL